MTSDAGRGANEPHAEPSAFMRLALEEADAALGTTAPNPAVGAVLVRDGVVVGRGHTQPPGGPHAEVMALRDAGDAARGATAYVTLEPCAHHGRTPPCTDALIEAGVAAVRYALVDPDPNVAGGGHGRLEAAGIDVEAGDGARQSARQLEGYLKHRLTERPAAVVKFAASLDGRIAASSGDSRWVSGPETLRWAHRNRPKLDAIVVGSATVIIDNPQLTARPEGVEGPVHQPLRIVLDSRGRIAPEARVLEGESPSLVATTAAASPEWRATIEARGAEVVQLPALDGHVDLEALLRELGRRGMLTVLFEGGGRVLGSLFDARLVDRVQAVVAPIIIGASDAPSAVAGRGVERMAQAPRLRDIEVTRLGEDVLIEGVPVWPDTAD
ncbi:MAG: bifunctional diaminohydroxyphosphoribosylaminopyrimidine deaminase/5-amino-6-(5-phosphoribosylamino)uracil reductase RibD [Dehalococcoidia bacterium]